MTDLAHEELDIIMGLMNEKAPEAVKHLGSEFVKDMSNRQLHYITITDHHFADAFKNSIQAMAATEDNLKAEAMLAATAVSMVIPRLVEAAIDIAPDNTKKFLMELIITRLQKMKNEL
jgi:hypothetical protein